MPLYVLNQLFFSLLLSKIITCQTLFIHNIGYLMCRDTLLEWNRQRNFPHCHSVAVKKIIIFDTAASSGKPRQGGLSGLFYLVLVLEAFCHFSTSYFLPQREGWWCLVFKRVPEQYPWNQEWSLLSLKPLPPHYLPPAVAHVTLSSWSKERNSLEQVEPWTISH